MRFVLLAIAIYLTNGAGLHAEVKNMQFLQGECAEQSHIAEGPVGSDLTKRQSRFFCDAFIKTGFDDDPKHLMLTFLTKKSEHARQIAFAGRMIDDATMEIDGVYFETGKKTKVDEGYCKFFGKDGSEAVTCGAKSDKGGIRTVPVISFKVTKVEAVKDFSNTPAAPEGTVRYDRSGVANCTLPGTSIDFALTGDGSAKVARAQSNYAPFKRAAQRKTWSASTASKDGKQMLVLDNGANTRIMVDLKDGRGMAFIGEKEGGVSDILCQILVRPQ